MIQKFRNRIVQERIESHSYPKVIIPGLIGTMNLGKSEILQGLQTYNFFY